MPKPLVTIVSVFHNRGAEVERSVNSLLAQTYAPLEIIVVDDGSTDDTALRLRAFKDPRLSVRIQPNQGFTRAVDAAVRSAKGEFIAIHGAGDISLPQRIEQQAKVLIDRPDVGVVGCFIENETGRRSGSSAATATGRPLTFTEMRASFPLSHGEAMFRKAAFEAVGGYRPFFSYAQDHDLWLRMSRVLAFWVVPELLYVRRQFDNSVATNPIKLMFQSYFVEFAEQCARSYEPGKGDLLDQHGQAAIFLLQKSNALAQKLNRIGLRQLVDGDEVKGQMILAASRRQSDQLRIVTGDLLGGLSRHQPRLWKTVLRPMLRPVILAALAKSSGPARPNVIATLQPRPGPLSGVGEVGHVKRSAAS